MIVTSHHAKAVFITGSLGKVISLDLKPARVRRTGGVSTMHLSPLPLPAEAVVTLPSHIVVVNAGGDGLDLACSSVRQL